MGEERADHQKCLPEDTVVPIIVIAQDDIFIFPSEGWKWAVFLDKCLVLITKIMGEKRKGHRKLCASTAVFWETTRMWEKSTWKIAFSSLILPWVEWIWASSGAKVAFLWVAWYCAWAEIPFLWLVCGQHFAEQSHVAVYVKERWVADNYRWIYWDFLLRVNSYMSADARNLK